VSIVINPSLCASVCLSVREHTCISGTAWPIFTKFCVQIRRGRGSVLLWRRCDTGAESDVRECVVYFLFLDMATFWWLPLKNATSTIGPNWRPLHAVGLLLTLAQSLTNFSLRPILLPHVHLLKLILEAIPQEDINRLAAERNIVAKKEKH